MSELINNILLLIGTVAFIFGFLKLLDYVSTSNMNYKNKPTQCPICKSRANFMYKESYEVWDLYECAACAAQWWNPLKHPGRDFYEEAYDMVGSHGHTAIGWGNTQLLNSSIPKGKLLDIGCCSGDFIHEAQSKGFDVWGIDISRRTINQAKALYGLKNVYPEKIEDFSARRDIPKFDVVTFFEVIEHIEAPYEFIQDAKKVLRPGGYMILSTPDRDCVRFGWHDHPPQHIFKWNERVLRQMLEKQGFDVVTVKREPMSYSYFIYAIFGGATPLSFGVVSKIKNILRKKAPTELTEGDSEIILNEPKILQLAKKGAEIKMKVTRVLLFPAVMVATLFRLKWQSIYVVARLRPEREGI